MSLPYLKGLIVPIVHRRVCKAIHYRTLPNFPTASSAISHVPPSVEGTFPSHRQLSRTILNVFVHMAFLLFRLLGVLPYVYL